MRAAVGAATRGAGDHDADVDHQAGVDAAAPTVDDARDDEDPGGVASTRHDVGLDDRGLAASSP